MVTIEDLYRYEMECAAENWEEEVVRRRDNADDSERRLMEGVEDAANTGGASGECFTEPRRCTSEEYGEVIELNVYGGSANVKRILEWFERTEAYYIGSMHFVDDGHYPASLIITVVENDTQPKRAWA